MIKQIVSTMYNNYTYFSLYKYAMKKQAKQVAPCELIQDNSAFHTVDSGFQVLDSGLLINGNWISDSLNLNQLSTLS